MVIETSKKGPTGRVPERDRPLRNRRRFLWRAVVSRDKRLDGAFVFAVRSTGVYCRPSCPARRPRPQNVQFFDTAEQAEVAGYRACRRCHPRNAWADPQAQLVWRACRLIEDAGEGSLRLGDLASACGVSGTHLQRTFRRLVGVSPRGYAEAVRLKGLKTRLREGKDVTTAIYEARYGSASRVYERSDRQLGMTPATYRRGGQNMDIAYSIAPSPLGRLLVAGTERGVSAVYLGEDDRKLESELRREYPSARIHKSSAAVGGWLKELVRHLSGSQPNLDLPLDVAATAFQRLVWEQLQKIPYGRTLTYGDVSRALGRPSATRAVARACATNPVSIIVPCHRVVRRDGNLAGYRWGVERKRALLEREKAASQKK